ncbi:C-X-C motif chemokine 11-6-like [Hyla sarda]|uniref:C-X-C motif chemokine 11-6-like n=1 Tax=Hyla sarda TaxID=327740 RepID=UPI0024C3529F|nr:C-X-C motif chemokine 11-6-like [Hyla sarda]
MYRPVIVVLCSLFLLQTCVQGMSLLGKRRCLCKRPGADHVDLKQIKKFEVFPPSPKCEKMEVIVTFKNATRGMCLNPDSKLVKSLIYYAKKRSSGK